MTSSGSTSPCPIGGRLFSSVHNMKAHARRTNPGTPIVAEGLTCVSATAPRSSKQVPHAQVTTENAKRINEQKTDNATLQAPMTAIALQPLLYGNLHQPLSPRRSTGNLSHMLWECPRRLPLSIRIFGENPCRTTALFETGNLATFLRTAHGRSLNSEHVV
ncbi:hypothetical protein TcCL_NonESM02408 [Trypanosoma cruzi]|nr:hypothetical protein TcCL_NonESM02408 [Trypanosoma cruzi]